MELDDETTAAIIKKHQFKTINAFYAAIGDGTVDVADVKEWILEHKQSAPMPAAPAEVDKKPKELIQEKGSDDILIIDAKNVKGIDYRMARCCNPVFGDDVFGFVTRTEGIKIHRMSCPNAARLMDMYPYRIQKVKWSETPSTGNFQTGLRITTALEPHVINEIMDIVNSFRASVRMFNVMENDRQGTYEISMKIAVPSSLELDKVTSQIRNLRNVVKISRM
jgi:GTP pyrophosphokinase